MVAVLDIASILGMVLGIGLMVFGILAGEGGKIGYFLDPPSALITFGGALATMLTMSPGIPEFLARLKSITLIMKVIPLNEEETIRSIIDLANIARKEGLLAVEEAANNIEDEFLKKGVLLIVDGTDPELVRSILETDLECIDSRHKTNITFWEDLAGMGPAWGMIGTLIGLVIMLKNMGADASAIGPSMAVALITTLYGSILANWICTPVANKLKANNSSEIVMKEVMVEGLLSIQAGENPRVIEEKLKSFLSPAAREQFTSSEGGEQVG